MNEERDTTPNTTPATQADASPDEGKLQYQKPAFRHEGVFETMALACGKISSTQAQCRSLSKTS